MTSPTTCARVLSTGAPCGAPAQLVPPSRYGCSALCAPCRRALDRAPRTGDRSGGAVAAMVAHAAARRPRHPARR